MTKAPGANGSHEQDEQEERHLLDLFAGFLATQHEDVPGALTIREDSVRSPRFHELVRRFRNAQ